MSMTAADALASVPLLSSLDKPHLEKLAKDFSKRTFPAGAVVVRQGDDHGIGFFVIAEGEASVTKNGERVATLGPGDSFGSIALISDRVRTATVTAETELVTWVMTLWDFRAFVQGDANVSWNLLQQLASMLRHEADVHH
jgi:CRP-like cAMP-binding protein